MASLWFWHNVTNVLLSSILGNAPVRNDLCPSVVQASTLFRWYSCYGITVFWNTGPRISLDRCHSFGETYLLGHQVTRDFQFYFEEGRSRFFPETVAPTFQATWSLLPKHLKLPSGRSEMSCCLKWSVVRWQCWRRTNDFNEKYWCFRSD